MGFMPGAVSGARNDLQEGGGLMLIAEASGVSAVNNTINVPFEVDFDEIERVVLEIELQPYRTTGTPTNLDLLVLEVVSDPAHQWERLVIAQGYSESDGSNLGSTPETRARGAQAELLHTSRAQDSGAFSSACVDVTMRETANQLALRSVEMMSGTYESQAWRSIVRTTRSLTELPSRRVTLAVKGVSPNTCDYSVKVYAQGKVKAVDGIAYEVLYDAQSETGGLPPTSIALHANDDIVIEADLAAINDGNVVAASDAVAYFGDKAANTGMWHATALWGTTGSTAASCVDRPGQAYLFLAYPNNAVVRTGRATTRISRNDNMSGAQLSIAVDQSGSTMTTTSSLINWKAAWKCGVSAPHDRTLNLEFAAHIKGHVRVLRKARVDLLTNSPDTFHGLKLTPFADKLGVTVRPGCLEIVGRVHHQSYPKEIPSLAAAIRAGESLPLSGEAYMYAVSMPDRSMQYVMSGTPPTMDRYGNISAPEDIDYSVSAHHPVEGRTWRCISRVLMDAGKIKAVAKVAYDTEPEDLTTREGLMDELIADIVFEDAALAPTVFPFTPGEELSFEAELRDVNNGPNAGASVTFGAAASNVGKYVSTLHWSAANGHSYTSATSNSLELFGSAGIYARHGVATVRVSTKADGSGIAKLESAIARTTAEARQYTTVMCAITGGAHMLEGFGTITTPADCRGRIRVYRRAVASMLVSNPGMRSGLSVQTLQDGSGVLIGKGVCEIGAKAYFVDVPEIVSLQGGETPNSTLYLYGCPGIGGKIAFKLLPEAPTMDPWGAVVGYDDIDYSLPCFHPVLGLTHRYLGKLWVDAAGKASSCGVDRLPAPLDLTTYEGSFDEVILDVDYSGKPAGTKYTFPVRPGDVLHIENAERSDTASPKGLLFYLGSVQVANSCRVVSHYTSQSTTQTGASTALQGNLPLGASSSAYSMLAVTDIKLFTGGVAQAMQATAHQQQDAHGEITYRRAYVYSNPTGMAEGFATIELNGQNDAGSVVITRKRKAAALNAAPGLKSGLTVHADGQNLTFDKGMLEIGGFAYRLSAQLVTTLPSILRVGEQIVPNSSLHVYAKPGAAGECTFLASVAFPTLDMWGDVRSVAEIGYDGPVFHPDEGLTCRYICTLQIGPDGNVLSVTAGGDDADAFLVKDGLADELVLERDLATCSAGDELTFNYELGEAFRIDIGVTDAPSGAGVHVYFGSEALSTNMIQNVDWYASTTMSARGAGTGGVIAMTDGVAMRLCGQCDCYVGHDGAMIANVDMSVRRTDAHQLLRRMRGYTSASGPHTHSKVCVMKVLYSGQHGRVRVTRKSRTKVVSGAPGLKAGLQVMGGNASCTVSPGYCEISGLVYENNAGSVVSNLRAGETLAKGRAYLYALPASSGAMAFALSVLAPTKTLWGTNVQEADIDYTLPVYHPEELNWRCIGVLDVDAALQTVSVPMSRDISALPAVAEGDQIEVLCDVKNDNGEIADVLVDVAPGDTIVFEGSVRTINGVAPTGNMLVYMFANSTVENAGKTAATGIQNSGTTGAASWNATWDQIFAIGSPPIAIWHATVTIDPLTRNAYATCRVSYYSASVWIIRTFTTSTTVETKQLLVKIAANARGGFRLWRTKKAALAIPNPDAMSGLELSVSGGNVIVDSGHCELAGYMVHNQKPLSVQPIAGNTVAGETLPADGTVYVYAKRGNAGALAAMLSTSLPGVDRYGNVIADFSALDSRKGLYHPTGGLRYLGAVVLASGAAAGVAQRLPYEAGALHGLRPLECRELLLEKNIVADSSDDIVIPLDPSKPFRLAVEALLWADGARVTGDQGTVRVFLGADADNVGAWKRGILNGTTATPTALVTTSNFFYFGVSKTTGLIGELRIQHEPASPHAGLMGVYMTDGTTTALAYGNRVDSAMCTVAPELRTSLRLQVDPALRGVIKVYRDAPAEITTPHIGHLKGLEMASADGRVVTVNAGSIEIAGKLHHVTAPVAFQHTDMRDGETLTPAAPVFAYAVTVGGQLQFKLSTTAPTMDRYGNIAANFDVVDLTDCYHPIEGRTWRFIGMHSVDLSGTLALCRKVTPTAWESTSVAGSGDFRVHTFRAGKRTVRRSYALVRRNGTGVFMRAAEYFAGTGGLVGCLRVDMSGGGTDTVVQHMLRSGGWVYAEPGNWITSGEAISVYEWQ